MGLVLWQPYWCSRTTLWCLSLPELPKSLEADRRIQIHVTYYRFVVSTIAKKHSLTWNMPGMIGNIVQQGNALRMRYCSKTEPHKTKWDVSKTKWDTHSQKVSDVAGVQAGNLYPDSMSFLQLEPGILPLISTNFMISLCSFDASANFQKRPKNIEKTQSKQTATVRGWWAQRLIGAVGMLTAL